MRNDRSILCVVIMMTWSYQAHTHAYTLPGEIKDKRVGACHSQIISDPSPNVINAPLDGFFF